MAATTLDSVRAFAGARTIHDDLGVLAVAPASDLARAVRRDSAERLRAVPATGRWSTARLAALLDGILTRELTCLPLAGGVALYGLRDDLVLAGETLRPVPALAAELAEGPGGILLVVPAWAQQAARCLVHDADLRMQWWR